MIRAKARGEAAAERGRGRRGRAAAAPAPGRQAAARRSSRPRPGRASSGSATPGSSELADRLNAEFGAGTVTIVQAALLVPAEKLVDVALYLRDKNPIKYDYLASLQSVHYEDCIEVNYQLDSTAKPGKLIELRVRTAEAEGAGRGPVALSRLPRGRLPGARGLRHDGRPLHRPPRADSAS